MAFLSYIKSEDNLLPLATFRASSEDSAHPLANLHTEPVAQAFQTAEGDVESQTIDIDFPFIQAADTIALIGHNLSSTATVTIKAGAQTPPTDFSSAATWRERTLFHKFSTQTKRYWRVEIDDPANTDGFIRIGMIVLGVRTEFGDGFDFGFSLARETRNRVNESTLGVPLAGANLFQRIVFSAEFTRLLDATRDTVLAWLDDLQREQKGVLVIPDHTTDSVFFGRFGEDHSVLQEGYNNARITGLQFLEDGVGFAASDPLPSYSDGDAASTYTFTRNSVAFKKDKDLKLVSAAVDELRSEHYYGHGVKGTLLEPARTNDWDASEDLADAAYTLTGATASANNTAAPDDVVSADLLREDGSAGEHNVVRDLEAHTNDKVQAVSCFIEPEGRTRAEASITNKAGNTYSVEFDLTTGATVGGGETGTGDYDIEEYGNGFWRIMLAQDAESGGTTPSFKVRLHNGTSFSYTGANDGTGVHVWGFQHEVDAVFPSSYIKTTTTSAARSVDALSITGAPDYQPMTAYTRFVNLGSHLNGVAIASVFDIEDEGAGSGRLRMYRAGAAQFQGHALNDDASEGEIGTVGDGLTAFGEVAEVLTNAFTQGAIQVHRSIDGAAVVSGTKTADNSTAPPSEIGADVALGVFADDDITTGFLLQRFELKRGIHSALAAFRLP